MIAGAILSLLGLAPRFEEAATIINATKAALPDNVGNGLACSSCHLNGGTVAYAAPLVGVWGVYPEYFARSGRVEGFADDELDRKPYAYVRHYLPHDARARTLVAGVSVQDEMIQRYGHSRVAITPHLSLPDGIQATRKLLASPRTRFHPRCDQKKLANDIQPFEAIRNYHYEWDEENKVLAKKPFHDWSSHTADALRYAAVVAQITMMLDKKEPEPPKPVIPSMDKAFNLEDLWEQRERERRN